MRVAVRDSKHRAYEAFFNSSRNGRGVGILIAHNLNITVIEQYSDLAENIILLKIKHSDSLVIVGAVYGPNSTDRNFFSEIERAINQLSNGSNLPIVVGGDWNTTWDGSQVNINIDTFQMAAVPNHINSELL